MIKILLVDDKPSVLHGLQLRLAVEQDLNVLGVACDGEAALMLAPVLRPDVVVMDVGMPRIDGITAAGRLRERLPEVAVVMLSVHDDAETQARALQAGATAFVEKRGRPETLIHAIRNAVLEKRNRRTSETNEQNDVQDS